jgi:hypothetical protein
MTGTAAASFHFLPGIRYSTRQARLLITWWLGILVIAVPKVLEFYDDFCSHRATSNPMGKIFSQ